MTSVLQPWVMQLGLRHQGVLVSAVRGYDTATRDDPSKLAQRILRGAILVSHGGAAVTPASYITFEPDSNAWYSAMQYFVAEMDQYPHHYVMHFVHAAEIIGYCGPKLDPVFGVRWRRLYFIACAHMHMRPETAELMNSRLDADELRFADEKRRLIDEDLVPDLD